MRFGEIFAGRRAYLSAIKPPQNTSQDYMSYASMAVADFTQFEFFANLIETAAVLCSTARDVALGHSRPGRQMSDAFNPMPNAGRQK
jgi:hypothetical protein